MSATKFCKSDALPLQFIGPYQILHYYYHWSVPHWCLALASICTLVDAGCRLQAVGGWIYKDLWWSGWCASCLGSEPNGMCYSLIPLIIIQMGFFRQKDKLSHLMCTTCSRKRTCQRKQCTTLNGALPPFMRVSQNLLKMCSTYSLYWCSWSWHGEPSNDCKTCMSSCS